MERRLCAKPEEGDDFAAEEVESPNFRLRLLKILRRYEDEEEDDEEEEEEETSQKDVEEAIESVSSSSSVVAVGPRISSTEEALGR